MVSYWVKTPRWLKKLFPPEMVWDIPAGGQPAVYLTFDDGPHPTATHYVLDLLKQYNAGATFFCVGNNVARYPAVYTDILTAGHTTGNHTYNHLNGWKTSNSHYLKNIDQAGKHISSRLFRPPYGRIRMSQVRKLRRKDPRWRIYMWDVLSADFDQNITPEQCLVNVLSNIRPGSIVLFHDSDKAWDRMSYALPLVLEYCKKRNWQMKALPA